VKIAPLRFSPKRTILVKKFRFAPDGFGPAITKGQP
jgi:hypothetical protein